MIIKVLNQLLIYILSFQINVLKSTKLTATIQTFSQAEFNEWKKFLLSHFFNTDTNLLKGYEVIAKYFPALDSPKFTKEKIYAKVFPGLPWNDAKWRNLSSKLVKTLEMYLSVSELKSNQFEQKKLLVKSLGKRNLYPIFEKEIRSLNQELSQSIPQDLSTLLDQALLNQLLYDHPLTDKVGNFELLNTSKKQMEDYYYSQQIRWSCEKLVLNTMRKRDDENKAPEATAKLPTTEKPLSLQLYQAINNFLDNGTIEDYLNSKFFFLENIENFTLADQKFGLLHLINFGIRQNNLGHHSYSEDIFGLYKKGIEHHLLLNQGRMTQTTFNNVVANAAALGHFDWAKDFIEGFERYLSPNIRENARVIALANLYFQQKDFSTVIDLLIHFTPSSLTKLLIAKTLLLRSYFEFFLSDHSYFELLLAYTLSFDKLVKRKKSMPQKRITGCLNLSASIRKMSKVIIEKKWDTEIKNAFLEEAKNQDMLIGKKWLVEKIKSL